MDEITFKLLGTLIIFYFSNHKDYFKASIPVSLC